MTSPSTRHRPALLGAALAGLCSAALLIVAGCGGPKSPFQPVEIAQAVKTSAVTPLIGKTIHAAWKERATTCLVSGAQCRVDETVHERVIDLGHSGVSILFDTGHTVTDIAYEAEWSSAEGVRHKAFLQENAFVEATWIDAFDVQNRSRTVYGVSGEKCWVRKPDTLRSSGEAARSRWFETETLSCEVSAAPDSG